MKLREAFLHVWLFQLFILSSVQIKSANRIINFKNKIVISEAMIHFIQSCYNKNESIVLSGDWDNSEVSKINKMLIPVYFVGLYEDSHFQRHQRLKNVFKMSIALIRKKKYPGINFIIMVSSNNTVQLALEMLKKSILWNHEGYFLIVCKNIETRCTTAQSLLQVVWSFRILSATLLCYDDNETIQMYSFNPYARLIPKSWNIVKDNGQKKNTWTLYRKQLDESFAKQSNLENTLCNDIKFDKTLNLDGYTIKMGAHINPKKLPYNDRKTGLRRFGGVNGQISCAIWTFLNVNANVIFYSKSGYVDAKNSLRSFLRDLLNGKIEFAMNMNLLRDFWKLQSYPHESGSFCMVTRKDTFPSIKIFGLIPCVKLLFMILGISIILVFVLKHLIKRTASFAFLELLRMMVTSPTVSLIPNSARKAFFVYFTLVMFMLSTYFQSFLTSHDVVPSINPTVDTESDLVNSNLMIYGTLQYNEFIPDLDVEHRYQFDNHAECINRLLSGEHIICITGCHEARFDAYEGDILHISREIRRFYMTFSTREDWPLYTRFNTLLSRLSEAGLIGLFRLRETYRYIQNLENKIKDQGNFRSNIKISWYLWSFGLLLACLMLIVEISFHKINSMSTAC